MIANKLSNDFILNSYDVFLAEQSGTLYLDPLLIFLLPVLL